MFHIIYAPKGRRVTKLSAMAVTIPDALPGRQVVKKKHLTPAPICSKIAKVGRVMDKLYEQTMLFDFYGELLTEHQRSVYREAVYLDLSLGEIAQERGISRQGVHDLIRRCDRILQEYENKLHLVERFTTAKKMVEEIQRLTVTAVNKENEAAQDPEGMQERFQAIRKLSRELLELL